MRPVTTAVTALRFISFSSLTSKAESVLFAGVANCLHVYNSHDRENPAVQKELLPPNFHIHGFSDASVKDYVAVHAGRVVVLLRPVFESDGSVSDVQIHAQRFFDDWVWHVSWPTQDPLALIVATGHSTVWICNPTDLNNAIRIKANEDELTWAATTFVADHDSTLYAASGSSFGDVLMWRVASVSALDSPNRSKDKGAVLFHSAARPVHRLKGHKGPVMRVLVRDNGHYMASASVDRSIRVWRAMLCNHCDSCPKCGCFEVVLTHYGHLARVWDIDFIQPNSQSVISVGEDRSCRIWSHCTSHRQLAVHRPHAGRNVWAVAVAPLAPGEKTVTFATGGEDGAIKTRTMHLWGDTSDATTAEIRSGIYDIPGNLSNPRKSGGANNESGRTIVLVTSKDLLISTDFGRILAARLCSQARGPEQTVRETESLRWTQLFCDDAGTAFTPCSLVLLNGIICAGQTNGDVIVFPTRFVCGAGVMTTGKPVRFNAFNGERFMVMGIFGKSTENHYEKFGYEVIGDCDQFFNGDENPEDFEDRYNSKAEDDVNGTKNRNSDSNNNSKSCESEIFVASPNGDLYQWVIQRSSATMEATNGVQVRYELVGVYGAHRASKTALVTSVCQMKVGPFVVVGDKGGRVHLFRRPNSYNNGHHKIRAVRWMRVHEDRVSSITQIDDTHIMSAGFDGRLVRMSICDKPNETAEMSIEKSERTAERTDTVVGVFERKNATCAVVAGFRGAVLIVWDVIQRAELFRHNVGNWRRAHAVRVTNDDSVTAAFWRAGRLHMVHSVDGGRHSERLGETASGTLTTGGAEFHGGRANDVAWIASDIVITGGEDTMVRVTRIDEAAGRLYWIQRLSGHISSVSGVCVARNGCLAATCGGSDEVLIWSRSNEDAWHCVLHVNVGHLLTSNHFCSSERHKTSTDDSYSAIMRVTGIDGGWNCRLHNASCAEWTVGRSDGSVVLLHSNKDVDGVWHIRGTLCGMHQDGAVVSVCYSGDTDKCSTIVSGGSGGTILVWTALGNCTERWENAHEGGVDCVAVRQLHKRPIIVASGGDDERVRVWRVGEYNGWKSDIGDGHHAAVTAIKFVDGTDVIVSLGADQLVIFWEVVVNENSLDVRRIAQCYTAIPDGAGICTRVTQRGDKFYIVVVVCGYGLEVLEGPSVERCKSDASRWTIKSI